MTRHTLNEARIHDAIRDRIAQAHRAIVDEVEQAVTAHGVVVVGMAQNPHCRRARVALDRAGIAYHYLQYGSYLGQWRRRNALKMWTGWPTFPMVFVGGTLVGGANELTALIASAEIEGMLGGG